jgi:outer membrane protein assembly factor BamE (lipoprotein component of BamABCDE complex)
MRKILIVAACGLLVAGCAVMRAKEAEKAQATMVGMSKEQILACMGPPVAKATEGATEVWSYNSGNGQTTGFGTSSASVQGGRGYAYGTGFSSMVTQQRFCTVNVTMVNGRVDRLNYVGPTGGLITQGEQCAFAIDNCVPKN